MKLTITRRAGGHNVGDTIEVGEGAGQHLIDAGYGEKAKANAKITADTVDADADADGSSADADDTTKKASSKRS